MTSRVFSDPLRELADEIAADEAALRLFVLARCVEIAKGSDAQAVKCLELISRLALGDKPLSGDSYTNHDPLNLAGLSREELVTLQVAAYGMMERFLEDSHGSNGSGSAPTE